MTQVTKFASADWNKLNFSDKKKAQTQGRPDNVYITWQKQYMNFQLKDLRVPFEVQKNEEEGSYVFNASLDKSNPKHAVLIAKAKEFDELIRNYIKTNSFALLKKKTIDDGFLSAMYTPFLRIKRDEETEEELYHNFKVKIPIDYKKDDHPLQTTFVDENDGTVDVDYLVQHSNVDVIIRPQKIFFATKIGTTWIANLVRVRRPAGLGDSAGNLFASDSDDEDAGAPESQAQPEQPAASDNPDESAPEASEAAAASDLPEDTSSAAPEETEEEEKDSTPVLSENAESSVKSAAEALDKLAAQNQPSDKSAAQQESVESAPSVKPSRGGRKIAVRKH